MREYRPALFTTPIKLLAPGYQTVKGVPRKIYPEDGELIWCSFKTYGGTERTVNDIYAIEDTAVIETWYRPDIRSDCRIMLAAFYLFTFLLFHYSTTIGLYLGTNAFMMHQPTR